VFRAAEGSEGGGEEASKRRVMSGAADDSLDTHTHVTQVTQARAITHTNMTGEIAERPTATDRYLHVARDMSRHHNTTHPLPTQKAVLQEDLLHASTQYTAYHLRFWSGGWWPCRLHTYSFLALGLNRSNAPVFTTTSGGC
jgi:hypothetical protein